MSVFKYAEARGKDELVQIEEKRKAADREKAEAMKKVRLLLLSGLPCLESQYFSCYYRRWPGKDSSMALVTITIFIYLALSVLSSIFFLNKIHYI